MTAESKNTTLLVVEDDRTLCDTIVCDLKRRGYNVFSANSATNALNILQSSEVHLVLSDIRMPGGDGLFLLEQIRTLYPYIPVILMTGASEYSEELCISKGASLVISKPFKPSTLLNSIKTHLSAKRLSNGQYK